LERELDFERVSESSFRQSLNMSSASRVLMLQAQAVLLYDFFRFVPFRVMRWSSPQSSE
jgi:hypothetical protein